MTNLSRAIAFIIAVAIGLAITALADQPINDGDAITQFQRAVDAYAFQHRQVQRRAGDAPDQSAMAAAMRTSRQAAVDGAVFTPAISAAFRARIAAALRTPTCRQSGGANSMVPRPNDDPGAAVPMAACVAAVLPRLPAELDYRVAGVALLLVDTHANLVVDVLHAAIP
jgi:hypothetical protein